MIHINRWSRRDLLVAAGGLLYTAGAVVYAIQRPNPNPRVFGYHEIFHLLVIAAVRRCYPSEDPFDSGHSPTKGKFCGAEG